MFLYRVLIHSTFSFLSFFFFLEFRGILRRNGSGLFIVEFLTIIGKDKVQVMKYVYVKGNNMSMIEEFRREIWFSFIGLNKGEIFEYQFIF